MGDSEEGGGGSVHWRLEAKKVGPGKADHQHSGQNVKQKGEDEDDKAKLGDHFTVSILKPDGLTQQAFLAFLQSPQGLKLSTKDPDRVYFNHPIEKKKAQIRVSWGESDHHEGTGGERSVLATGTTRQP